VGKLLVSVALAFAFSYLRDVRLKIMGWRWQNGAKAFQSPS